MNQAPERFRTAQGLFNAGFEVMEFDRREQAKRDKNERDLRMLRVIIEYSKAGRLIPGFGEEFNP